MKSRNYNQRRRRRSGFTLMEVLLVMAILVILGSFVTLAYVNVQRGADVKAAGIQLSTFEQAIGFYQLDIGRIPPSLEALREMPADLPNPIKYTGPYLKTDLPLDPWGNEYLYEADLQSNQFVIKSLGPDGAEGNDDIIKESSL